jgi:hypothetical protein
MAQQQQLGSAQVEGAAIMAGSAAALSHPSNRPL